MRMDNWKFEILQQYLTSKLTGILTQTVTSTPLRSPPSPLPLQDTELKQEDDMDELFDNMETVGDRYLIYVVNTNRN